MADAVVTNETLQEKSSTGSDENPIAMYWRKVREGQAGYSAVRGAETNELIQGSGENWRRLRNGPIAVYGGWLLVGTFVALLGFYMFRGPLRMAHSLSGKTILRWTLFERLLHWYTAVLFIILSLTGLSLLFGRSVLIPLLGPAVFAAYADVAKLIHNFLGPPFILGLVLMIAIWMKDNLPTRVDIEWFKAFGGMIGNKHPSAGRMNGGEKAWFWLLAAAGIAVAVSGLILDFPNFGQDRFTLQISHLLHVVAAIFVMAGAIAHIYIGSIGTEGALRGMITGEVDSEWAKQHHDIWYQEVFEDSKVVEPEEPVDPKFPGATDSPLRD